VCAGPATTLRRGPPMFRQYDISRDVRRLLERHYLESASSQAKGEFTRLSDDQKRKVVRDFLQDKAGAPKAWATALLDLL
jgi:hypothetical protein